MDHLELINNFIESLPYLDKDEVPEDSCCAICLIPFEEIFEDVSIDKPLDGGVTQLPSCQHIFCRHDLVEWIRGMHGSCPTCRRTFISNIRPPSDSDGESSDGGEYIPNDEEDDEEDSYLVDTDGFTEADEFDVEMGEVDLDVYQSWQPSDIDDAVDDGSSEWGLTDGDSVSNSDGDISFESESVSVHSDTNIIIQEDEDDNRSVSSQNDENK
ncbi:hypothetical protein BT96DRAFT_871338 [Gymnopus androsaceus JB14]|uniref:RING-type domain-containing protein n=1 Tax=Gymnopus androsaceus JB14 TaxID=1447944 RepID=A0A6A4IQF9_9AGAR|nr:hypothetical protein BT96DRAFT_871338 [Gymnopus androsaceus JB14]